MHNILLKATINKKRSSSTSHKKTTGWFDYILSSTFIYESTYYKC